MLPHEIVIPYKGSAAISCAGGAVVGIDVRALQRGTIKKLRVIQLTGTLDGFNYTLYNTVGACDALGSPDVGVDERLYRITPRLIVAVGADSYASAELYPEDGVSNLDMPYEVLDGYDGDAFAGTPSSRSIRLRLRIEAAGTGAKTFGIAMTIINPQLS